MKLSRLEKVMLEALYEAEWAIPGEGAMDCLCPVCGQPRWRGHVDDCAIAEAIEEAEEVS